MAMVRDARDALRGVITETPLFEDEDINGMLGGRLFVKAEPLQRTGAFKIRGAYNRIRQLDEVGRERGVIAYSSGNHAQAVATAARQFGVRAVIVMPHDAPATKMARTRQLGAEVIVYERGSETREAVAERIQAERNLVLVPPNEDARVLAGAATLASELFEQVKAHNAELDAVLVPCGGGGLTAAVAIVAEDVSPRTKVYAVEPELFDDTRRSLEVGERVSNPSGRTTICDSIMTDQPGTLTFSINRSRVASVLTVSDKEVCSAMKVGFDNYKLVIEPGAAVGLAAVLAGKLDNRGKRIAVIATGGNVDASTFCQCYRGAPSAVA
jgi:threonine dehydratase